MPDLPSHFICTPCFLVYKCGIYHLCHIYLLLSIYIFARREFVQIYYYNILIKDFKKSTRTSKKVSICNILTY